jgi:transposase
MGFGLAQALDAAGIRCVVAAPSTLRRPAGDRVKTDAKDAVRLARLLRPPRPRRPGTWSGRGRTVAGT